MTPENLIIQLRALVKADQSAERDAKGLVRRVVPLGPVPPVAPSSRGGAWLGPRRVGFLVAVVR